MSQSVPSSQNGVAPPAEPNLTAVRFERAMSEKLAVEYITPLSYEVHHDGEIYAIDLESGHCTCPDRQFRGLGCKHAIKCALHALFTDGSQRRFIAQVATFAQKQGCPFDARGCDGPCGVGVYPCPDCVAGVGVGDWDVWTHLVRDTGGERR